MMKNVVALLLLLLFTSGMSSMSHASWLSEQTGVNVDLSKIRNGFEATKPAIVLEKKLDHVQPPAAVPDKPDVYVSDSDRTSLLEQISVYYNESTRIAGFYKRTSIGIAIGAILIGLIASIAGFLSASKLAGICSIVATTLVGAANALPIDQNADFYQILSAKSHRVLIDAQLSSRMTLSEYKKNRDDFETLLDYEGKNFPSRGNTQQAVEDLEQKLNGGIKISQNE